MKPVFEQLTPKILRNAEKLLQINQLVHASLPASAQPHCRVSGIDAHTLRIVVDSPAWATRLRQLAPQILSELQKKRHSPCWGQDLARLIPEQLRHIRVISRPGQVEKPASRQNAQGRIQGRRTLSPQAAHMVQQTAAYIEDPRLRAALLRLAKHAQGQP